MENAVRSERSRRAILEAALSVIARDGPHRFTLDAIARESGISKGGVMHQFRTKEAVLKALMEQHLVRFEASSQAFLTSYGSKHSEPVLAAQIATLGEITSQPHSAALAIVGVLTEEPDLLATFRDIDSAKVAAIKSEAADPELAILRWTAARGLMLSALLGLCPLSARDRKALFERLLDPAAWAGCAKAVKSRPARRTSRQKVH